MNLFGQTTVGAPSNRAADTKISARYAAAVGGYVAKLSVYMDGNGNGASMPQVHRGFVHDSAGKLLGVSEEVTIDPGQPEGWVDFLFAQPVQYAAGLVRLGMISGGMTNTSRIWTVAQDGEGGSLTTDSYTDGPSDPVGALGAVAYRPSMYATFVRQWVAPPNVDDFYIGRLPFTESQELFSVGGPLATPVFQVDCGWYGTNIDADRGAFALVRAGSPLEVLLGERVRVTRTDEFVQQPVYLFVKNTYALLEDVAMPRAMFARLGGLSVDDITVRVEVIAG